MGQKKGQTGNPKGRPKGIPNKVTTDIKAWIAQIIDGNREQFEEDLRNMEPGERVRCITSLFQYVAPKLQSLSADEALRREKEMLQDLLIDAPDVFVDRIAEKLKQLEKLEQDGD